MPQLDRKQPARLLEQLTLCGTSSIQRLDNPGIAHHDANMRTTINISDAILAELKERARSRRRPLREIVDETLKRGLAAPGGTRRKANLPTFDVGIKPAYRGMSLNQLYDQLEAEDNLKVAEE